RSGHSIPWPLLRPPPAGAIATAALLAACGSAPPPTSAPPPAVPAAAPPAPAAVDLSEVPEPAAIVRLARWKSPEAWAHTIEHWTAVKLDLQEMLSEILPDAKLSSLVATDAPIDGVVALDPAASERDPAPFAAFAIGLKSLDDAKKAAEPKGLAEV